MKIRNLFLAALLLGGLHSFGQDGWNQHNLSGQDNHPNVITTAVPFVSIAPDARGGAMGDCGVATDPDVYSMHYNPAKYVYMEDDLSIGLGYSPWLHNLVPDMHLAYLAFQKKLTDRSALAATLRYFDCGSIKFTDDQGNDRGTYDPNEWAIDVTYSRMLGDYLSGAVSGRFIYSNLTQGQSEYGNAQVGWSVAADIGLYYKRPVEWFSSVDADFSWGVSVTNIGSKVSYNGDSDLKDFIPTTLRAGAQLKLELDEYNTLAFTADLSKLLVPTPPVREQGTGEVIHGYDDNVSVVMGMIQSFYDAPGYDREDGHKIGVAYEELCEINEGIGIEYWYNNTFAVRGGFFNEPAMKGNRKYVTLGAALKYNVFSLDLSYLIPVAAKAGTSPLENTLRFNLTYNMGKKTR